MTLLGSITQFVLGSAADVLPIAIFRFVFQRLFRGETVSETMADVMPKLGNKIITDQKGNSVLPLLQMQLQKK